MAKTFPPDRFDSIPEDLTRVGAHRAPPRRGRGWITFAWAALATGILVAGGVIALSLFTDSINIDLPFTPGPAASVDASPTSSVAETAAPQQDPNIAITILNGTGTQGLANTVGDDLVARGWAGAAIGVGSRANAGADDVTSTVVFYSDPINEAAARALVADLGVGEIRFGEEYPASPVTVLLGADYQVPAAG